LKQITITKTTITLPATESQDRISQLIGRLHAELLAHGYGMVQVRYRAGAVVEIVVEKSEIAS